MYFKLLLAFFILNVIFSATKIKAAEDCFAERIQLYDYVIVGGGTAGCVLAARLSEDPNKLVLLLEAGDVPPVLSKTVPSYTLLYLLGYGFNYLADYNGVGKMITIYSPQGKMLGGTSSMNGGVFIRGNKKNFEKWNELANGWSWDDVLPFYMKTENYSINPTKTDLHSTNGPIHIETHGKGDKLLDEFISKFQEEMSLPEVDPNDGVQSGVYYTPMNMDNKVRQTSYTGYLEKAMNRRNLIVHTNAFVEKLVFDETDKTRVTNVIYSQNGEKITVKVFKEVILCAGVINTPQLLMLSGVGPSEKLRKLGINVVKQLPVGENLMDHFGVMHSLKVEGLGIKFSEPLRYDSATAFYASEKEENGNPDIEIELIAISNYYVSVTYLTRPESKGYIELKSRDPYEHPKIVPNHLNKETTDKKRLAKGVEKASKLFVKMNLSSIEGGDCIEEKTDPDYYECVVEDESSTVFHLVGTCKMGSDSSLSVVDNKSKVHGLKNVRIADASVFPEHISGNPVATVLMIAERAAHFIDIDYKEEEKKRKKG